MQSTREDGRDRLMTLFSKDDHDKDTEKTSPEFRGRSGSKSMRMHVGPWLKDELEKGAREEKRKSKNGKLKHSSLGKEGTNQEKTGDVIVHKEAALKAYQNMEDARWEGYAKDAADMVLHPLHDRLFSVYSLLLTPQLLHSLMMKTQASIISTYTFWPLTENKHGSSTLASIDSCSSSILWYVEFLLLLSIIFLSLTFASLPSLDQAQADKANGVLGPLWVTAPKVVHRPNGEVERDLG